MRNKYHGTVLVVSLLFSIALNAQVTLETFFEQMKHFIAADYSKVNLEKLKQWTDSISELNNSKAKTHHTYLRGKIVVFDSITIKFDLLTIDMKKITEKKSDGAVIISSNGVCNSRLVCSVLKLLTEYNLSFDTIRVISGINCSCSEIRLHFNNYSPSTNKVLESVDTSLIMLLKHEYFDFYFTDLNRRTSKWQTENRTFMQPYSDALITLLERDNIQRIFKLINLKNKGYSWFLAEGLWYYNSIHPCLAPDQIKIIEAYNGRNGMLFFRSAEELKQVYKF